MLYLLNSYNFCDWFFVGSALGFEYTGLNRSMGPTVVSKLSWKYMISSIFVVIRCIRELDYVCIDIIYIQ
jgi:hypothetical protein